MKPYSGRVIFDHLPKTAGQSIVDWLTGCLGNRIVMPKARWLDHDDCIVKYGGYYSVLTGHLNFFGGGLDGRYTYFSILRDPVERSLSALNFHVRNFRPEDLPMGLWQASYDFLDRNGDVSDSELAILGDFVSNGMVNHFARVLKTSFGSEIEKLSFALDAIKEYEHFGFYERIDEFVSDLALFFGIEGAPRLDRVNVTNNKPERADYSSALIDKLRELNSSDISFYEKLMDRYHESREAFLCKTQNNGMLGSVRLDVVSIDESSCDAARICGSRVLSRNILRAGDIFSCSFSLDVFELIREINVELVLYDDLGVCVFRVDSSAAVSRMPSDLSPGVHEIIVNFATSEIPDRGYKVKIAFRFSCDFGVFCLRSFDAFGFKVIRDRNINFGGSVYLPTNFFID